MILELDRLIVLTMLPIAMGSRLQSSSMHGYDYGGGGDDVVEMRQHLVVLDVGDGVDEWMASNGGEWGVSFSLLGVVSSPYIGLQRMD